MDFNTAANAHRDWKIRLRRYVNGTGEALDEATVRRDDRCALGQWLHGLPSEARDPLVDELVQEHARFHGCAGDVVAAAQRGDRERALEMIGSGTAFAEASFQVVSLISRVATR